MEKLAVVVVAAGLGTRMGAERNKTLLQLDGEPMFIHTVRAFTGLSFVDPVVVVVRREEVGHVKDLLQSRGITAHVVEGGNHRQASVLAGLEALPDSTRWVAIHDGARPLVTPAIVEKGFALVQKKGAVGVGVPVKDTIKVVDKDTILETPDRSKLWAIQTPQFFAFPSILEAHFKAADEGFVGTDDCSLLERLGESVYILEGSYSNLKITTPEDMVLAEAFCRRTSADDTEPSETQVTSPQRVSLGGSAMIGFGYDVHRLVPGRALILCGVPIPHDLGLDGHSDADVAAHALMDGLLGATGLGDIGKHFPDTDEAYRGADSMLLLAQVMASLKAHDVQPVNVDITIAAQAPKLAPWIPAMRSRLAQALDLPEQRVNVKATTTEGLGFVGQKQGIAAYAAVSCTTL